VNNQIGFTGRSWTHDRLYYYRARWYNPTRHVPRPRFAGFAAGDVNLYRYVGNNPLPTPIPPATGKPAAAAAAGVGCGKYLAGLDAHDGRIW